MSQAKHRSIIIDGTTTSLSMEAEFWKELDRQAAEKGLPWQELTRQILKEKGRVPNRSASVKITLMKALKDSCEEYRSKDFTSRWRVRISSAEQVMTVFGVRLLVGRGVQNDIVIDDTGVSRTHLILVHDNRHWWCVDLESKNGTTVDGKKVLVARLETGTTVRIGNSKLELMT